MVNSAYMSTKGRSVVNIEQVIEAISEVREEFQREEDQGLLQRDLHKAEQALAGKYACDRILRRIEPRVNRTLVNVSTMGRRK